MTKIKTSVTDPIRVDFVQSDKLVVPGKLGMTFAPGKTQEHAASGSWARNLEMDLQRLRDEYHTDLLVSLLEEHEYSLLQIANLRERAVDYGMEVLWFPIGDGSYPKSIDEFGAAVECVVVALRSGKTVVVHCKGGWGRTGILAAATLLSVTSDLTPEGAVATVRRIRQGAVENESQERFIAAYAEHLRR